jgi:transposase
MNKFRLPRSRDQIALLPASIEEYVTLDDAVRYVDVLVDEFDLEGLEARFSYRGRPAYQPRVIIKVLLYGKLRGMRSSRELARACRENLRFLYLAREEKPDFRTISNFRKNHLDLLGTLLKQTVEIGINEGFIDLKHVAVDGTKIRANSSAKSFQKPEKLRELLDALEKSLQDDVKADEQEDEDQGDDDGDFKLPKRLEDRKAVAERLRESLQRYDSLEKDERPSHISKTDGDARFMKGPEGKRPSYNAQLAMDEKSRMVVGARVTNACSDQNELQPMIQEIKSTTGQNPDKISADKGYRATPGLVALENEKIEGFVPLQGSSSKRIPASHFIFDDEEDEYICPEGRVLVHIGEKRNLQVDIYESENCNGCSRHASCIVGPNSRRTLKVSFDIGTVERMKLRMETSTGRLMSKARSKTVELGFAWKKVHQKLCRFMFRGRATVNDEWKFEAAALNVARLVSGRMKLAAQAS